MASSDCRVTLGKLLYFEKITPRGSMEKGPCRSNIVAEGCGEGGEELWATEKIGSGWWG